MQPIYTIIANEEDPNTLDAQRFVVDYYFHLTLPEQQIILSSVFDNDYDEVSLKKLYYKFLEITNDTFQKFSPEKYEELNKNMAEIQDQDESKDEERVREMEKNLSIDTDTNFENHYSKATATKNHSKQLLKQYTNYYKVYKLFDTEQKLDIFDINDIDGNKFFSRIADIVSWIRNPTNNKFKNKLPKTTVELFNDFITDENKKNEFLNIMLTYQIKNE